MTKAVKLLVVGLPLVVGCERMSDGAELPRWTAQEDLRIGSADDSQHAFQWVGGLEVSPAGTIFATVPNDHNIRIYRADGALIQVVGRLGGGPGEFSNPGSLGWLGDTLWVHDAFNQRVTLLHRTGTVVRMLDPMVRAPHLGAARLVFRSVLPDGSLLTQARPLQQPQAGEVLRVPIIRLFLNGSTDTIAITTERSAALIVRKPRGELHMLQPFVARVPPAVSITDRMIVIAEARTGNEEGRSYRLSKLSLDGDTSFTVEQKADPVRIDNRVVDAKLDELTGLGRKTMGDRAPGLNTMKEWVRKAMYTPVHAPVATGLVVGSDGRIFVRNAEVGDSAQWTIFSARGEPLGRFAVTRHIHILTADAAHLYGTGTDDLDVPVIVRYRLRRGS